jgi:hypothetical protein
MSVSLDPLSRLLVVRNLVIDQLTAEIAKTFAEDGIDTLVLKGPALAEWLYPGEVRPYGDSDIMVAPGDWDQAVTVLNRLGFSDYLGPMAHPRMESFSGTCFARDDKGVDLHCALDGLEGDREAIWVSLLAGSESQLIGGAELLVPGRPALLMHVGLHAAHHVKGKPIEDLRRAITHADERLWRQALELARDFDGLPAFASGLRLLPEGVELTRRLGLEDVRSPLHELRKEAVPMAEGIDALLSPGIGVRQRLAMLVKELFPRPEFMRWWSPDLANRGRFGLTAAYLVRIIWLVAHLPRGLYAWCRSHSRAR